MIVVMRVRKPEFEQVGPFRWPINFEVNLGRAIGYLPVYATLEDARADYPDGPFQEVALLQMGVTP